MGIVKEDIERVRELTDIVAVVSEHTQLKRVGTQWVGLCPFHAEKSGSFYVNGEIGVYHCHGCKVGGDAITFVREIDGLDFAASVEVLAGKAGVTLRYDKAAQSENSKRRAHLVEILGRAVEWYHERLLGSADARGARRYLRERGFDGDAVRHYQLGYAPDAWDAMVRDLRISRDDIKATGLGFINRSGKAQDFFRDRVLFPIFDAKGDPVSFGGRLLPGGQGGKYINLSETRLYDKSRTLYGLNWAKRSAVAADRIVICEGYTDVIGFHRAGIENAVATCGTALTEDHIKMLTKFTRRLVLAFDADSAGQAAAERIYAWEKSHEIEVSVVDLSGSTDLSGSSASSGATDPDELSRSDPEALVAAVDAAVPYLGFRVARAISRAELDTPEARARAAEAAVAVIREHPNDIVRDQYVMEVADVVRVSPDQLRYRLSQAPPVEIDLRAGRERGRNKGDSSGRRPARRAMAVAPLDLGGSEVMALRLAVHEPAEVASLLIAELFMHPVTRSAFEALLDADSLTAAIDVAPAPAAALLTKIAVEQDQADATGTDNVVRLMSTWVTSRIATTNDELRAGREFADVNAEQTALKLLIERAGDINRAEAQAEAIAELLAWIHTVEAEDSGGANVS